MLAIGGGGLRWLCALLVYSFGGHLELVSHALQRAMGSVAIYKLVSAEVLSSISSTNELRALSRGCCGVYNTASGR